MKILTALLISLIPGMVLANSGSIQFESAGAEAVTSSTSVNSSNNYTPLTLAGWGKVTLSSISTTDNGILVLTTSPRQETGNWLTRGSSGTAGAGTSAETRLS